MTEVELFNRAKPFFEAGQWSIFQEVRFEGATIDMVLDNREVVVTIEGKTNLSADVLFQADRWREHANRSAILIPATKKTKAMQWYKETILSRLSLDIIEVDASKTGMNAVQWHHTPKFNKVDIQPLRSMLKVEQKTAAPAGSNGNKGHSKNQRTYDNIREFVCENPCGVTAVDVMNSVETHFRTKQGGVNAINAYARRGTIDGVEAKEAFGKTYLYPAETN